MTLPLISSQSQSITKIEESSSFKGKMDGSVGSFHGHKVEWIDDAKANSVIHRLATQEMSNISKR